jgi:hypothetical protein
MAIIFSMRAGAPCLARLRLHRCNVSAERIFLGRRDFQVIVQARGALGEVVRHLRLALFLCHGAGVAATVRCRRGILRVDGGASHAQDGQANQDIFTEVVHGDPLAMVE